MIEKHTQLLFHSSSLFVALWFLIANFFGADTMPYISYGTASSILPISIWSLWVIISCIIYLIGYYVSNNKIKLFGAYAHLANLITLSLVILFTGPFNAVVLWTIIFSVWLFALLQNRN